MTTRESQKPKTTRGTVLGQFLAVQRLQGEGVQQSIGQSLAEAQVGQGQRFTLETVLGKVDEARLQIRQRSGFRPGLLMSRRNERRAEFFQAFSQPRTIIVNQDPGPEERPAPPQPSPKAYRCPWEGCDFTTDDPGAFQLHVTAHGRFYPRTY